MSRNLLHVFEDVDTPLQVLNDGTREVRGGCRSFEERKEVRGISLARSRSASILTTHVSSANLARVDNVEGRGGNTVGNGVETEAIPYQSVP